MGTGPQQEIHLNTAEKEHGEFKTLKANADEEKKESKIEK